MSGYVELLRNAAKATEAALDRVIEVETTLAAVKMWMQDVKSDGDMAWEALRIILEGKAPK